MTGVWLQSEFNQSPRSVIQPLAGISETWEVAILWKYPQRWQLRTNFGSTQWRYSSDLSPKQCSLQHHHTLVNITYMHGIRQMRTPWADGPKYGHYHMPETQGLCLSEEQTV
ncbi:hypothetical protein RJ641_015480 [Dillenia turbinata]|uniref:Uncharacterized protein n=1 Tax=Dillenia turbinata TaxID=194707 RepID=A0AAN8Z056_9MAGN